MTKAIKPGDASKKNPKKDTDSGRSSELKTDVPLSEKDEVKQAEERLRKAIKKRG